MVTDVTLALGKGVKQMMFAVANPGVLSSPLPQVLLPNLFLTTEISPYSILMCKTWTVCQTFSFPEIIAFY